MNPIIKVEYIHTMQLDNNDVGKYNSTSKYSAGDVGLRPFLASRAGTTEQDTLTAGMEEDYLFALAMM